MVTSVRLQNFRSYKEGSFEFEPGVNIVVGPNAAGKTNLLESVMVLARGGSYRGRDMDLVRRGRPWARLDGLFANQARAVKLEVSGEAVAKSFLLDGRPYKRLGLERSLPLVFFEPSHLGFINRGPKSRRDYFDELLERTHTGYKQLMSRYNRTLAQRNALLKKGRLPAREQIFAWDVRLSETGEKLATARQRLLERLNQDLPAIYSRIAAHKSQASVSYAKNFEIDHYGSRMVSRLQKNLERDLERGFTSAGPHREDFNFFINSRPVSSDASRGETRSLLLALKTLELELVEKTAGQKPIFLLDDVFSELDGARRRSLVEMLAGHQSILTTTDADTVVEYFTGGDHQLIALGG